MPNSFATTANLTCAHCHHAFTAELWLIVDTVERPDLLARIRAQTLHDTTCPQCHQSTTPDAPLLVFRPDQRPVLTFLPRWQSTAHQNAQDARQLVHLLQANLGAAWNEAWLADTDTLPPLDERAATSPAPPDEEEAAEPADLPPALAALFAELAAEGVRLESEADLEQLFTERPELQERFAEAMREAPQEAAPPLLRTLDAFVRAQSWAESQRIVEAHPELLDEAALTLLDDLIAQQDEEPVRQMLAEHQALLQRCRTVGVARAFAEKQLPPEALAEAERLGMPPEDFLAAQRAAAEMPPALREVLTILATEGIEIRSAEELEAALETRPALRAKLEQASSANGNGIVIPPEFQALIRTAQAAEQQYLQRGDRQALENAATTWLQILNHPQFPSAPARFWLAALNDGGGVFLRLYWVRGRLADLNRALDCFQQAVAQTPADAPDLPSRLNNLGNGLRARYARTGRLEDLEQAIGVYQQAVAQTPADAPDLPGYLNNLGTGLSDRYARTGRLEDLEQAIGVYQQAVAQTPTDAPDLPSRLNNLGTGLSDRYARTGRLEDLEQAIGVYQQAVAQTPADAPDLPSRLNNLGNGLSDRYARTGRLEDLEQAIGVYQQAVAQTPADAPDLPSILNNLGTGLRARYARTGRLEDLEQAIGVYQQAVAQTPADAPDLPGYLNNLGTGLSDRYARTGRLEDLEQAIGVYQQAVAQTPADAPDLPSRLNNLGTGLSDRYARTGRLEDLEQAIGVYQQAVAQTPTDAPDLPSRLNNLGNGLRARYARTGRLEDLEQAIGVYQQAVAQTPADAPDLPSRLNNLGTGLRARYARTGRLEDLEQAIGVYQQAVAQTPADAPDLPSRLNNLGTGLRARYARTGRLEDLEEAIGVYQQAVAQTPADAPDLPSRLNNLGTGLRARYARTGRLEDLEQAIGVYQQAVAQTPADAPDLPGYLNNLGTGLSDRYARTGRLEDIEQAIGVYQQAVAQTPADAPDLPSRLNNLGTGLRARYARTGRLEDLEQAIGVYQQAVAQTPADAPDLPSRLNNLGTGLRARYARTGRLEDLEQAIAHYEDACRRGLDVAPEETLRSARNWGQWMSELRNWQAAQHAYGYGLTAVERFFALQLVRDDQEHVLRLGQGLAAQAALACAHTGQLAAAVTTMERGRARLLGEALERNRTDLALLPARGHTDLYQRYLSIVQRRQQLLQQAESAATGKFDPARATRLQALETLQRDLNDVIAAIQQLPGYTDFLAKPNFDQIQAVVRGSATGISKDAGHVDALVYLLTTGQGGLALVVHGGGVAPLWLDITDAQVREWLVGPPNEPQLGGWLGAYQDWLWQRTPATQLAWFDQIESTTRHLWDAIMGPLAAALHGLAAPPETVTLIPTGLLALLPLHAAWTEVAERAGDKSPSPSLGEGTGKGVRYFLDDFAVGYAPSALALRHAQARLATVSPQRVLAIDEPRPVAGNALPNSAREVAAIVDHFAQQTILSHDQATRQAVLDALAQGVDVAHFSCHGGNDWDNPLETALFMAHDEPLTVRDLLELRLPGARLASLSACETGLAGTQLPDEVVMLPSALLQAGFAGVAASLWSVADVSTAMLMARFYDLWRGEGVEPVHALRQAQQWVRDTTNREKADYFAVHLAEEQPSGTTRMSAGVAVDFLNKMWDFDDRNARTFAHPFWWAAFTFTGV